MTKKQTPTKTKSTKPNLEETIEAPPEPSATQKLDTVIRAKALSLVQTAIAEMWAFIEKPNKDEFDPEVIELVAGRETLKPPSLLEGALAGQMLNGLVIRPKLRIKPASMPRTPISRANQPAPRVEAPSSTPTGPDLLAERLLKATTGRKK